MHGFAINPERGDQFYAKFPQKSNLNEFFWQTQVGCRRGKLLGKVIFYCAFLQSFRNDKCLRKSRINASESCWSWRKLEKAWHSLKWFVVRILLSEWKLLVTRSDQSWWNRRRPGPGMPRFAIVVEFPQLLDNSWPKVWTDSFASFVVSAKFEDMQLKEQHC